MRTPTKFVLLLALLGWSGAAAMPRSEDAVEDIITLDIVHVNDIHAHFDEMSDMNARCTEELSEAGKCVGGIARMYSKLLELRETVAGADKNLLFLNAGDFYQGTIWYTLFKYEPVLEFGNLLNYTAMGLGNHDFDDGVAGLAPFVEEANYPVLACNVVEEGEAILTEHVSNSTVVEVAGGKKVGIIGYVLQDTEWISSPGPTISFDNVVESVRAEAARLKAAGVEMVIALGHYGYDEDVAMAQQIPDLDLVVGGHSHTFLYNGPAPSREQGRGPYPTYVTVNGTDKVVPVVQAFAYTKYMGHLRINFDPATGDLLSPVQGVGVTYANVYMLDSSVPKNAEVEAKLDEYRANMTEYYEVIGSTLVNLTDYVEEEGVTHGETNLGNAVADSMAAVFEDADIAFINDGGLRAPIYAGSITGEDVFNTLPFDNMIDMVTILGADIKGLLEEYAAQLCPTADCYATTFLQMSGLRVVYNILDDNVNDRVTEMSVRCPSDASQWCPMDMGAVYAVALNDFLADGGARRVYSFEDVIIERIPGNRSDYEVFVDYIEKNDPIDITVEGRITILYGGGGGDGGENSVPRLQINSLLLISAMLCVWKMC